MSMTGDALDAMFERALEMAEANLTAAAADAPDLADMLPFAMLEAAANAAVAIAGPEDVVLLLRSFADQIAADTVEEAESGPLS
jgi:hypothetical protein